MQRPTRDIAPIRPGQASESFPTRRLDLRDHRIDGRSVAAAVDNDGGAAPGKVQRDPTADILPAPVTNATLPANIRSTAQAVRRITFAAFSAIIMARSSTVLMTADEATTIDQSPVT